MVGTGSYLKSPNPKLVNLAYFTALGDRVPGPRPIDLIQAVDLPWREAIDAAEHITSVDSYSESLSLCWQGLLCGPSSGMGLRGLYQYLSKAISSDELERLLGPDSFVTCVFTCCDLPFLYISDYFEKLGPEYFPSIERAELLTVDQYPYATAWRLMPEDAHALYRSPSNTKILDVRDTARFSAFHIDGALNLDIRASTEPNPFLDYQTLVRQWTALEASLGRKGAMKVLYESKVVFIVDEEGHTAAVVCSILHHYDAHASHLVGGMVEWAKLGLPLISARDYVRVSNL